MLSIILQPCFVLGDFLNFEKKLEYNTILGILGKR